MIIKHGLIVGGDEVNENYLTLDEADELALEYLEDNYPPEDIFVTYHIIKE